VIKLELKYNPKNKKLASYSMSMWFLKQGMLMEWINFCKTFSKILTEQGIKDNAQAKYTMARMLLKGDALKQFEAKALRVDESNNNFNECMKVMAIHIFPIKPLQSRSTT